MSMGSSETYFCNTTLKSGNIFSIMGSTKQKKRRLLSDLVNVNNPQLVCEEVLKIISLLFPPSAPDQFDRMFLKAFDDIVGFFGGRYPGYRACNTDYHDLRHTMDTLLAMARTIHGVVIAGTAFSKETTILGLVSALMHDTGFIQSINDIKGTGAKYTNTHVKRSVAFASRYFKEAGYPKEYSYKCSIMINYTDISTPISEIRFVSDEVAAMGKILGTADLIGQMADMLYLEKLLFLFCEFQEAGLVTHKNELELLKNTMSFYPFAEKRLSVELGGMHNYLHNHFIHRWEIHDNLYDVSIRKNIKYLDVILSNHAKDYRNLLKRGIAKNLKKK